VGKGLSGKPDCLIETNARTHFDLETGKTNAQIAFMMGKVKASNVQLMIKFYKLFNDLPET
jgi:putative sterol carrier protein